MRARHNYAKVNTVFKKKSATDWRRYAQSITLPSRHCKRRRILLKNLVVYRLTINTRIECIYVCDHECASFMHCAGADFVYYTCNMPCMHRDHDHEQCVLGYMVNTSADGGHKGCRNTTPYNTSPHCSRKHYAF